MPSPDDYRANVSRGLEAARLYIREKGVTVKPKKISRSDLDALYLQELDAAVKLYQSVGGKTPEQPGEAKHNAA